MEIDWGEIFMPKKSELLDALDNSKIKEISASLKNFKGCSVKYAYDKENQVYSVRVDLQGRPYILTTKVGPKIVEMILTDLKGNLVEHAYQNGKDVVFKKAY